MTTSPLNSGPYRSTTCNSTTKEESMATLRDTVNLADQLTELTQQLHGELTDGDVDFDKMIQIADEISEQADQLAAAFERVNEALSEPLDHQENGNSSQSSSS